MAVEVIGGYPRLTRNDLRFMLIEATDRLLPSLDESLARLALDELRARGIEVRLETQLNDAEGGSLQLSDDTVIESDTLVWVAGIAPHKLAGRLGLPTDDTGRLQVQADLRVRGQANAWAAGDCASVPDLVAGGTCPPTAQYAVRQGRHLAKNLTAVVRGERPEPFRYSSRGEFVTLGMRKGVAEVFGHEMAGFGAWLLRRSYYGLQIPTPNRKLRVFLDWTVRMPFGHDVVDLGSQQEPQAALKEAVGDEPS
jgi:NADH dehydrogenase